VLGQGPRRTSVDVKLWPLVAAGVCLDDVLLRLDAEVALERLVDDACIVDMRLGESVKS
jgi:hypothetical protein